MVLVALLAAGCALPGELISGIPEPGGGPAPSVPVPPESAAQPTPAADPPAPDFPKPHPRFAARFTDPLYYDEGEEFAPFGSDRGAQAVAAVLRRSLPAPSYPFVVVGRGESDPAVPNTSEKNRRINRRVVITQQTG